MEKREDLFSILWNIQPLDFVRDVVDQLKGHHYECTDIGRIFFNLPKSTIENHEFFWSRIRKDGKILCLFFEQLIIGFFFLKK